ncbi:hypothetical protein KV112_18315 [Mycolicibacter sp. MYC123]|uniref:Uncharacterized protein n=1 Tax=[Mycobacterium] zoologicum TaxID=2872311 RepID=A0ABU5YPB4_9MYCO|nr:hypothetical protein [Mycolicibacter sp. MYC123]MEB3051671.1 hypothetical protein [Mycolicibacter sp. MYC123]
MNRRLLLRHGLHLFDFLVLDALARSADGSVRMDAEAVRVYYLIQISRPQVIALGDTCRRISVSLQASAKSKRRKRG